MKPIYFRPFVSNSISNWYLVPSFLLTRRPDLSFHARRSNSGDRVPNLRGTSSSPPWKQFPFFVLLVREVLLMVQKSGENHLRLVVYPFFTGFCTSQVVGPGISEPSTVDHKFFVGGFMEKHVIFAKESVKTTKKCNVQIILHQTITPLKTNGWIPKMMVWKRCLLLDMAIFWYLCVLQKPSLVMKKFMRVWLSLECMY